MKKHFLLFAALIAIALTRCDVMNTPDTTEDPVKVAAPAAWPGGSAVLAGDTVTLSTETEGALIYYTTDGAAPDRTGTQYNEPIVIDRALTIKAFAVKEGMEDSDALEAVYTILKTAAPAAAPPAGEVDFGTAVTLATTTEGASIYYTANGDAPTSASTLYVNPIQITQAVTLRAIAVKERYADSDVLTAAYTVVSPDTAARPSADPPGGTVDNNTAVTLATTTEGASIYYTLDNTAPTSGSALYENPVTISGEAGAVVTLKAIAVKGGKNNSAILEEVYTVKENGNGNENGNENEDGNENNPASVSIFTEEDFAKIGKEADYPLNGIYTLEADITLTGWTPVGTKAQPFTGELRGNGKTITLESFHPAALQGEYIGVLGYASGAKAEDLTLSLGLSSQTTIGMPSEGDQFIGGLTAHALRSEFAGIRAEGALNLKKTIPRNITAGAIAGVLERSTVRDSVSTVALTVNVSAMSGSSITTGGIAGSADLSAIFTSSYTGTLNCTAIATVTAGGIAGVLRDHRSSQPKYGGDFGIYDCSASGTIISGAGSIPAIGGIAGRAAGSLYNPGVITRCAAKMNISGDATPVTTMSTPMGFAGGIVAGLGSYGVVSDSYFRGNVTLVSAFQDLYAGGLAGTTAGDIFRCYAAGTVSVQTRAYSIYYAQYPISIYAGGITGLLSNSSIENCAALNAEIRLGKYAEDGPGPGPRRIAGGGGGLSGNIANRDMVITITKHSNDTPDPPLMEKTAGGMDGGDCDPKPNADVFTAMGWDFVNVWKMGADGYPALAWEQ